MLILRRRSKVQNSSDFSEVEKDREDDKKDRGKEKPKPKQDGGERRIKKWTCVDSCCWFIGCICLIWWFLLFLYNAMPASFPQYVAEAITGPLPDPPGVKLKKEGLTAKHPVVFVPGIVTGGLELWEGHQCADGLFRKRLWGGTFGEVYKGFDFYMLFLDFA
ncbi:phospholipid:diacylglycerol acyltransferase 1-like [Hevea brasiliensis]|uniref:phospholipid:diacylglycerol acyltransferase 1-like n=1 Tax=Hevea brasiliensis TaxID=3981 RepID=UPI0025FB653C|nr:phospholipid:diacylglycerol acyltransferase 1-like [Hevea brasiliensis]